MKNALISILLAVSCIVYGQSMTMGGPVLVTPNLTEVGGDSLLAFYRFETNLDDEQDNYDGTAEGTLTYSSSTVKEGSNSLIIDAFNDASNIGTVDFTSEFTISIWHYYNNSSNSGALVLFSNRSSTANDDGFAIWLNSWATTDGRILVYTGDGTEQDNAYSATGVYNSSQWNHICIRYNGSGDWDFWINNSDETVDGTTQDDFATSGETTMIGNYTSLNYSGDGNYDKVQIFDKALTDSEISTLYNE